MEAVVIFLNVFAIASPIFSDETNAAPTLPCPIEFGTIADLDSPTLVLTDISVSSFIVNLCHRSEGVKTVQE